MPAHDGASPMPSPLASRTPRTTRTQRSHIARLLTLAGACLICGVAPAIGQEESGKKQEQPQTPQPVNPQPAPTKPNPAPTTKPHTPIPNQSVPKSTPTKPADPNQPGFTTGKQPEHANQPADGANAAHAANTVDLPVPPPDPDSWTINATGELNLADLVRMVQRELNIQILIADGGLQDKTVVLTAPVKIKNEQVLAFVTKLLETKGYTIFRDEFGIYTVMPTTTGQPPGEGVNTNDPYSSTQVMTTKGIKPSSISSLMPALGSGGTGGQIVALDEFGVIIITDTTARTRLIRDFIDQLAKIRDGTQIIPLDVRYVSATTARDRMLSLVGESSGSSGAPGLIQSPGGVTNKPGNVPIPGAIGGGAGSGTSNLSAQLTVSPFSNALFFRGREEDAGFVRQLLMLVDVQNRMEAKFYPIGMRAAEVISAMGTREGLGEITTQEISQDATGSPFTSGGRQLNQLGQPNVGVPGGQQSQTTSLAGSGFVIFPEPGGFMYYGTAEQHARVNDLIEKNRNLTVGEQVVYRFYKLKNTKAEEVADIITSLITNQEQAGNTGNIIGNELGRGGAGNRRGSSRNNRNNQDGLGLNQANQRDRSNTSGSGNSTAGGIGGIEADDGTFVMADEKQNQIIVKTRNALQPEFAKLIEKLDARRPQVYIEAQIVSVTGSENFRLAFEQQWLAGQFGVNTNFGLSGTRTNFLDRKSVSTGLPGLTAAIIQSDKVPLIITALQNNNDGRVIATPQLLVDENETATVTSRRIVQTQVTTTIDSQPQVSVGSPVEAGTELTVTPRISQNAVNLDVFVSQSAFVGAGTATLPPDTQDDSIESGSVTVPRDATIVIGGLSTENLGKTVVKVPLLGDIPLIGLLFRDTTTTKQNTTLYVFITPRVMTDPNFMDVRLLSQGPAREMKIKSDFLVPGPELMTSPIDMPKLPEFTSPPVSSAITPPATTEAPGTTNAAPMPGTPITPPPAPEPMEADIPKKKE